MTYDCNLIAMISTVIYDILFILAGILMLPWYLHKKKRIASLIRRIRECGAAHTARTIWIHCVSVGEVLSIQELLKQLKASYAPYEFVISTVTPTGYEVARQYYAHEAEIRFLPLDISWMVQRAIKRINPALFVCLETELWPNLYCFLHRRGVPIVIVNARISPQAFKKYRLVRFFLKRLFNSVRYISVQHQTYYGRFMQLGARREQLVIGGNLKFANSKRVDHGKLQQITDAWHASLRADSRTMVIVAGSTHHPEESYLWESFLRLKRSGAYLKLVVCPRHPERAEKIRRSAAQRGIGVACLSDLKHSTRTADAVIVDVMGILSYLYSFADIVYMGGTLVNVGGHNILEPAYFLKPIIFGPSMFNFEDMREIFLLHNAAVQIKSAGELTAALGRLLSSRQLREMFAKNIRQLLEDEQTSLPKNMELIRKCLP